MAKLPTSASPVRHKTQYEIIKEVMEKATVEGEWLTLAEISDLTYFGEASISAVLRRFRKEGCQLFKRIRHGQVWEYRVTA